MYACASCSPRPGLHELATFTGLDTSGGGGQVVQLSGSTMHSMALTADGTVWSWGSALTGHHDSTVVKPKALRSAAMGHVVQIACGQEHSLCLNREGPVFAWGYNDMGELGLSELGYLPVPSRANVPGGPVSSLSAVPNHSHSIHTT